MTVHRLPVAFRPPPLRVVEQAPAGTYLFGHPFTVTGWLDGYQIVSAGGATECRFEGKDSATLAKRTCDLLNAPLVEETDTHRRLAVSVEMARPGARQGSLPDARGALPANGQAS